MNNHHEHSRAKPERNGKRNKRGKEDHNLQLVNKKSTKTYHNKANESCKPVVGLTPQGVELIKAIRRTTILFVTGPPGSSKTFSPTAMAADALAQGIISKVVCTRPMISCGNDIGILPGDVSEKFMPYMMPIMDVFNQRIGKSTVDSFVKDKKISHVPLQLMRGSSIDNAVILADECQNATVEQLTMLLTRIGENTTLVINGDVRQKDIPNSGLHYVINKLKHIDGIEHIEMGINDIVRSGIVKDIVIALYKD